MDYPVMAGSPQAFIQPAHEFVQPAYFTDQVMMPQGQPMVLEQCAPAPLPPVIPMVPLDPGIPAPMEVTMQPVQASRNFRPTNIWRSVISKWVALTAVWQVAIVLLFCFLVRYGEGAKTVDVRPLANPVAASAYSFFMDVHVMIFIGFGFLMTFLRKYAFGALGYTLFLACICIQWHVLVDSFWWNAINAKEGLAWEDKIGINLNSLLAGDYAAAAVLISFGALLGKANILQLTVLAIFEVLLFSLNKNIGKRLGVADIGSSMAIHLFGAYFGLGAALVLTTKKDKQQSEHNATSTYMSDLTAMIGTLFLFVFWPSFNGAPAGSGTQQQRAVINTLLCMTGSVAAAFLCSPVMNRNRSFNMVDIQNASIAGGVAMGAIADMNVGPGFAILIGLGAGTIAVFGYAKLMPLLEKGGLHDTCGIHNLHGLPAIYSVILSAIYCAIAKPEDYKTDFPFNFPRRAEEGRSASDQAWIQIAVMAITFGIAFFGGVVVGAIARIRFFADPENLHQPFNDRNYWDHQGDHAHNLHRRPSHPNYYVSAGGNNIHNNSPMTMSMAQPPVVVAPATLY